MSEEDRRRQSLLGSLIGASVDGQAIVGFTQMWKQSALYRSVQTDADLFEFLALMSQANTADSDVKMQAFYEAVRSYNSDPGHTDDLSKIRECLDLAVEALAVKRVSVEAVMKIQRAGEGGRAFQLLPSQPPQDDEVPEEKDLPELVRVSGDFVSKEDFIESLKDQQVAENSAGVECMKTCSTETSVAHEFTEISVAKDGSNGPRMITSSKSVCVSVVC